MIIDYMKVGERVREKRKTAGRTQAQLAEAVDGHHVRRPNAGMIHRKLH